jgi:phage major head subunit gpT-like protein
MSKSQPDIIAMTADVTIDAAEGEAKKGPRKFDVVAYTGGKLVVAGDDQPVVVDLKGLTGRKSIVANLDHDRKLRVGHVTARHNDGKTLRLEGLASAATAARDEVVASADDGFQWQASIEAAPQKLVKVPSGKTAEVNGQSFEGPFLIARKSVLGGFAFLSHGADEDTSVTIAASAADSTKELSMELTQWIEAMGFDPADLSDKQKAALQAKYDAEIKAAAKDNKEKDPPDVGLPDFDADEIKAAASDHLASLEAIFAEHEGEVKAEKFAAIRAEASKAAKELKVKALKERWVGPRYEAELIRAAANVELALVRAERPKGPAIHASNRSELKGDVIEAALCQAIGLPKIEKEFSEQTLQAAHSEFRGRLGLHQAIIMAAEANGYPRRDYRIDQGNIREIMRYAFAPPIHAASALSLPGILSNVANKELLAGFTEEDQTWREVAVTKPVTDFKAVTSYRMLDNMEYEELSPEGKIAHGQLGQESYTRQAKTYAKMFALTRVDIINDDLGAFNDLRTRLGRGSSRKFNNLFWAKFLNNASFFTAARGNYIEGATTNLGIDGVGLEAGVLKFRQMKTADGKRLDGAPDRLLIPPELQFNGQRLHQSTQVNTGGAATATSVPNENIHAGKYRPVVQNRLSDATFTGWSATAWYLFRDPQILAPMVVSFLNGVETPTVESADADFDQLGVQFRGYHDFGVDFAEWLAGVKSKGAA